VTRVAAAALVIAAALIAGTGARADRPPLSVGVNVPTWDYTADDPARAQVYDRLGQAGVRWIRIDIPTVAVGEPGYAALIDASVRDARAHGFHILGTLWGSPRPRLAAVPQADWYVRQARIAADRWRLDAWEVWNEPDAKLFWHGTPEQYGRLLRAVYPVLRGYGALVVHAGLAHSDPRWLRRSFGAGARFDVLGAHPYPTRHTGSPARTLSKLTPLRALTHKPIWITELGWSTYSGGVSERQQARNVTATLRLLHARYAYVRRVFFFEGRDTGTTDSWLARLGLMRRDLTAKPALAALGSA